MANDEDGNLNAVNDFYLAFLINALLGLCLLTMFEIFRIVWPNEYHPRCSSTNTVSSRNPPMPPLLPFGWIVGVLKVDNRTVLSAAGLDAYMLLRTVHLLYRRALLSIFITFAVLFPLYHSGHGKQQDESSFSIENLTEEEDWSKLVGVVIMAYVTCAYTLYTLYEEHKVFLKLRVNFLLKGNPDVPLQTYYTVMVEHIPHEYRSNRALREFFNSIFPNQVHSAVVLSEVRELDRLLSHRAQVLDRIERVLWREKISGVSPSDMRLRVPGTCCQFTTRAVIATLSQRIYILNESVKSLQQKIRHASEEQEIADGRKFDRAGGFSRWRGKSQETARTDIEPLGEGGFLANTEVGMADTEEGRGKGYSTDGETARSSMSSTTAELTRNKIDSLPPETELSRLAVPGRDKGLSTLSSVSSIDGAARQRHRFKFSKRSSMENITGNISQIIRTQGSSPSHRHSRLSDVFGPDVEKDSEEKGVEEQEEEEEEEEGGGHKFFGLGAVLDIAQEAVGNAHFFGNATVRLTSAIGDGVGLVTQRHTGRSSTGFVTFRSQVVREMATQMVLSRQKGKFSTNQAPEARDLIWENAPSPDKQVSLRTDIATIAFVLFGVGYVIAMSFFASLSKYSTLDKYLHMPTLSATSTNAISGVLSACLSLTAMSVLPPLFTSLGRYYEGYKTFSQLERVAMGRVFAFSATAVVVGILVSVSLDIVEKGFKNFETFITDIGNAIPSSAYLFSSMLLVKTFIGFPIYLLRLKDLLNTLYIKVRLGRYATPRQGKSGLSAVTRPDPHYILPSLLFVYMISATFEFINPVIIVPFSFLFFLCACIVVKYRIIYVCVPKYAKGGKLWHMSFHCICLALTFSHFLLFAYLFSRSLYRLTSACAGLPVMVFFTHWYCNRTFRPVAGRLSLENLRVMEMALAKPLADGRGVKHDLIVGTFSDTAYLQPSLTCGDAQGMGVTIQFAVERPDVDESTEKPSDSTESGEGVV